MTQSDSNIARPTATLTRNRLSCMVMVGLLVWMPASFLAIMASDSPNSMKSNLAVATCYVIFTYPVYAIAAAILACIANYIGSARLASYVLALPAFLAAAMVSLFVMPILIAILLGDGPHALRYGFPLSLVSAFFFILWSFRQAPSVKPASSPRIAEA